MLGQTNNTNNTNNRDKALNLDLADYWMIIQKRAFDIILVFILALLVTYAITRGQKPVYEAVCKIKIAARQPMATIEGAQITWYGGGQAASIQSEMELIANKDSIAELVCEVVRERGEGPRFKENENYFTPDEIKYIRAINFDFGREKIDSLTAAGVKGKLKTEAIVGSDIVLVKVRDEEPRLAEVIANVYAMAYKADFWKSKTLDAKATKNFIEEQFKDITAQLESKREVLTEISEENVFVGSDEVYKDEISRLKIELKKLSERYQPEHPRIIKLKNLIKAIEEELARIPQAKHEYDDKLADWERKQAMRQTLGEYHLKAEIDYKAKREKTRDEIQIISMSAEGSAVKVKPQTTLNILAGAVFGLILALIYAFVSEGLDASIGRIEDLERITGLHVIAHIPVIGLDKGLASSFLKPARPFTKFLMRLFGSSESERPIDIYKNVLFNFHPLSIESESYRTLRTNIQFAVGVQKSHGIVIGITSTSPKEGKTLTATNLAIALAQLGKKTILLEADMRRPQISDIFKLHKKEGLSDLLVGSVKRNDAICTSSDLLMGGIDWDKLLSTTGIDNLHFIPSGTIPPHPGELLISSEFSQLISKLREEYSYVIIDTPPTLPVADSSIVGTVVDGMIMIYQSDKTSRHLLLRALDLLNKSNVNLIGIVINQLAFDVVIKSSHYGYEYYSKGGLEKQREQKSKA